MAIVLPNGVVPSGAREKLIDHLPLKTPYLVEVFPIYACNLKCRYCMISTDRKKHGYITGTTVMEFTTFVSLVNHLAVHDKVRLLRFAGLGEPLLHRQLVSMIAYAKELGVSDQIEILTNGTLLLSDSSLGRQLVEAGVTRLIVSIQGMSSQRYQEVCGKPFEPEAIAAYLRQLMRGCPGVEIYVKIVDTALSPGAEQEDEKRFYATFDKSCHKMAVERTVPIHPTVDYSTQLDERSNEYTQYGGKRTGVQICPRPFMSMHVLPDGNVIPCYSLEYPLIIGNIKEDSLMNIWEGEKLREFRRQMVLQGRKCNTVCAECRIIEHRILIDDILDDRVEQLSKLY